MTITADEQELLLIHLVRCEDVMSKAVGKLDPGDFGSAEMMDMALWKTASDYYKVYRRAVPKGIFRAEVRKHLQEFGPVDEAMVEHRINNVFNVPDEGLNPTWALRVLQRFLHDRKVVPIASQLHMGGDGDIPAIIRKMHAMTAKMQVSAAEAFSMKNTDLSSMFSRKKKIRTGARFLDGPLGGGFQPGNMIGIIGPTGGGKTTCVQTLVSSWAMQARKSALFLYEEPAEDVIPRILISHANVNRDDVENRDWSDIPVTVRDKLVKSHDEIADFVDVVEFSGVDAGMGGPDEIRQYLQDSAHKGAELVIVDHIGPMSIRYLQHSDKGVDPNMVRLTIKSFVDELRALSNDMGTVTVILNQVNADAQKSNSRVPSHIDASECRTFAEHLHYCFCMGVKDEGGHCWWHLSKARNMPTSKHTLFIDGAHCRVKLQGGMSMDPRGGGFVRDDGTGAMPSVDGSGMHMALGEEADL